MLVHVDTAAAMAEQAAGEVVGRVEALWRYPVKSMLGEPLQVARVGRSGLLGDRDYALWDHATGRVASAKNPRLWQNLLGFMARCLESADPASGPTGVTITAPAEGRWAEGAPAWSAAIQTSTAGSPSAWAGR